MFFLDVQDFLGRPDTGVEDDVGESLQVFAIFVESRKEAIFFVCSELVELSLAVLPCREFSQHSVAHQTTGIIADNPLPYRHVEKLVDYVLVSSYCDRSMRSAEPCFSLLQLDEIILNHTRRDVVKRLLAELFQQPPAVLLIELSSKRRFVVAGIVHVDFVEALGEVLQVGVFQERARPNLSFQVIFIIPRLFFGSD